MAHFVDGGSKGFAALAALPFGVIVKLNSAQQIVLATSATDTIIGIMAEAVTAGRTGNVRLRNAAGTSNVVLGGTVAIGDALTSTATGTAITTVTAGNQVIGYAIEAGVAGQVIEIWQATLKY